jgi:hypothetical protein
MRPVVQQWHSAITQVAPPDLEELYLCAVLSCVDPGVCLYTMADICLDESIVIHGGSIKAVQHLGIDSEQFTKCRTGELIKRNTTSNFLNILIPKGVAPWSCSPADETIHGFETIMKRLDADEYLWARMGMFMNNTIVIQGFLQSRHHVKPSRYSLQRT